MADDNVMVSIWCPTCNHRDYIKDALEGFIAQKTNFLYKVIVFDDMSTDGTLDIVREYREKYPKIIQVITLEDKLFSKPEKRKALKQKYLTGKYVSLCDGDDYWIDCNKLQIQFDYMESHPECSLCLHNGLLIDCRELSMRTQNPYDCDIEKDVSAEEFIMQYRMNPPTASMIFRRELLTETPKFVYETMVADYAMQLYALTKGSVHYSSRIMSVYRLARKGSYTDMAAGSNMFRFAFYVGIIDFLFQYDVYTNYKSHIWVIDKIQEYVSWFAWADLDTGIKEYYHECKKQFFVPHTCEEWIEKLECLRCQTLDESYCSDELKKFIKRYEYIILMGVGKYSSIITKQIEKNHIEFTGYAVSCKEEDAEDYFMGKPVWQLSDIPYDKEDMGVIVAINPKRWDNLVHSLENASIKNYYCPFLLMK